MRDYADHPELGLFVLEESFVLGVAAAPGELTLRSMTVQLDIDVCGPPSP